MGLDTDMGMDSTALSFSGRVGSEDSSFSRTESVNVTGESQGVSKFRSMLPVVNSVQRSPGHGRFAPKRGASFAPGLRPTPYTLHPTPYTLHPKPYTLNPAPYTLNPKP